MILRNFNSYQVINIIFAGIIILIFIYSGIFSAQEENHPISSSSQILFDKETPSTGLSRAFSEIVRLNFEKAKEYNPHSLKVFMFFFAQFFMRIGFLLIAAKIQTKRIKIIVTIDIIISVALYICCFYDVVPL